ncbi:T9SS type A sorting domain-containing protein [Flavobacterium zepuense]|uniref:T9SS type A sorting domain-containing protein n=1 Tax=Flavobacterium zepuense TaxID=2593302 RepID=A0A552V5H6_9FLAO|nr:choice-of-anchor J domain-containing protein [Flavobacterium zepuense]TRW25709.1 T9SS type A sorting domain-containing protein [Flavobacterium zepuense]
MKKNLLLAAFLMGAVFTTNAQTTLFSDNFDSYEDFIIDPIGDWTQIDNDGSATYGIENEDNVSYIFDNSGYTGTAIIFNPSATEPALEDNWAPYSGNKSLNFFAATDGLNDDWFVTPQITLGSTGNTVTFWAKSITDTWGLERINIAVSTTGNEDSEDFTIISGDDYTEVPAGEWTQFTFNLDDYSGEQVYIAINYVTADAFALLVDDFAVSTTGTVSVKDVLASKFSVSPNPATNVININNAENILVSNVSIVDINGRTVNSKSFDGVASAQINISNLAAGVYIMNISSHKGTISKKIVKN